MKTKNFYSLAVLAFFAFLSAGSYVQQMMTQKNFYQTFSTTPEDAEFLDNAVMFEDERCKVSYNLWAEGGDIGFVMYNKTSDFITIEPDRLFFVLNGFSYAYDYEKIVIPPKTSTKVTEFMITDQYYNNCNLDKSPLKNDTTAVTFTKATSPFVFYNLIAYSFKGVTYMMENRFYVSGIRNYPKNEMVKNIKQEECGKKSGKTIEVFKNSSPACFYVTYSKFVNEDGDE